MRLSRLVPLAAISMLVIFASARADELPEGKGKALVRTACSPCHSADLLLDQPRSRESWTDVVSQMVGNGAQLSDDDFKVVIDYLATNLGLASQNATGHATATAPAGQSRN